MPSSDRTADSQKQALLLSNVTSEEAVTVIGDGGYIARKIIVISPFNLKDTNTKKRDPLLFSPHVYKPGLLDNLRLTCLQYRLNYFKC